MWQSFYAALCFLSILPIPSNWLKRQDEPEVQGNSILFYPLVGLILGLVLIAASFSFSIFDNLLVAALIVVVWVLITGALHLDGLADTADAWLGGHGDRERTLNILKDTRTGVAGVVAIVLLLIIKILAVSEIQVSLWLALILAPVLGRTTVMILLLTTDYVRQGGIGTNLISAMPRNMAWTVVSIVVVLTVVVLQVHALYILGSSLLVIFLYRILILHRLGGTTGDTAGALVEIVEAVVLLSFAAIEFQLQ